MGSPLPFPENLPEEFRQEIELRYLQPDESMSGSCFYFVPRLDSWIAESEEAEDMLRSAMPGAAILSTAEAARRLQAID